MTMKNDAQNDLAFSNSYLLLFDNNIELGIYEAIFYRFHTSTIFDD